MIQVLVILLLSQTPQAVNIADPAINSKKVTTTTSGAKVLLDVNCPTCTGSGGATTQGTALDGGLDWATRSKVWDGTDTVQVTATSGGALQVECVGGTCGGAAAFNDNSAFTFGTTGITNVGAVFDDVAPNAVTENSAATPRMSSKRVLYGQLRDAAGNERGANVNASNQLSVSVDNTPAVTNTNLDVALSTRLAESTFTGRYPAAGALSDNFANPTTTQIGAFGMLWDGATWDRAPGTSADGALVNLGANNDVTVTSGTLIATQATGTNLHVVVDSAPSTAVTGPLTDVQLRASAVPVSLTSTTITGSVTTTNANLDVALSTRLAESTFTGRYPAAGALSDNFANPTTTQIGAFGMLWDGATWDRAPGTSVDGALVNLGANNDVTVTSGSITVTQGTGTNLHVVVDTAPTTAVTGPLTDVQLRATAVPVSLTSTTITGTVAATQSGTWTVQPGNTPNTAPWLTTDTPRTVSSANNSGTCVTVTAASTTVLASNASRKAYGFKASEDNTAKVYCKLGATATTSNTIFGAGASWSQDTGAVYTGVIDCISASGSQSVCPYEFN